MDLFEHEAKIDTATKPLAARMRPSQLSDVVGQDHLLGSGKLLRRAIEADRIGSIILYGPPGCGKTSLAQVIAHSTNRQFEQTSGVLANIAMLRSLLEAAQQRLQRGRETILFIDEIHRFNKAQQDALLPYVEEGTVTLIGATTHNPFFFINSPLTSRSQVFELEPVSIQGIVSLLDRAILQDDILQGQKLNVDDHAKVHLATVCEGDARRALNAFELAALTTEPDDTGFVHVTSDIIADSIQKKPVVYDHDEDGHYDTISAFIKSVRGCDPDAAVYWLAKMLYAGEDPRFIARRLIILASEDIGNADPRGLAVAVAASDAVHFVGMPEARIILAQATTYLACAPKSNASYVAIDKAMADVKNGRVLAVPKHLRNPSYSGAEKLGHGGYDYAHNVQDNITGQVHMAADTSYYEPTDQGYEGTIAKRLAHWRSLRQERATPLDRDR